jgi:hypothetical protein
MKSITILVGRTQETDVGVDRRMTLKWVPKKQKCVGLEWTHSTQDTGQWQAQVTTVMNLGFR